MRASSADVTTWGSHREILSVSEKPTTAPPKSRAATTSSRRPKYHLMELASPALAEAADRRGGECTSLLVKPAYRRPPTAPPKIGNSLSRLFDPPPIGCGAAAVALSAEA